MTQRHEDSDDDTYVTLGSAFEKLETVEDVEKAKRKKDKEHYVTDEQGRRRFHGAFTGGFSAGYYNTVGSEEGWTPSNFVSSKGKKTSFSGQRPEDYMDAEDLGDYGIAPRAISAKEAFDQKSSVAGVKRDSDSLRAVIPGTPALQNLIVPARSSMGSKLLRTMGWKEGQGVGPKTARQQGGAKKVYGCSLPGKEGEGPSPSYPREMDGFLFAPSDVTSWEAEGKDDMHGIGYRGIQDQAILGSRKATKALYGMSGEAFGVGALEDGDEEEDNVYGVEALTSYDSALAHEGEIAMERKFGWTGAQQTGEWNLSSFKKASKHTINTRKYPPPDVPRDFVCQHKFGASEAPPTGPGVGPGAGPGMGGRTKPFSSTERSQVLSDRPDSVFNLLSESDREKLKMATRGGVAATRGGVAATRGGVTATHGGVTATHGGVAAARGGVAATQGGLAAARGGLAFTHGGVATTEHVPGHGGPLPAQPGTSAVSRPVAGEQVTLKPFSTDPAKRARYEAFLAGKSMSGPPNAGGHMTEWERQKEVEEFTRAAKVFQPLSASLSSRFTSGDKEVTGVTGKKEEQPARPLTPESDAVQAAKASMFGILTRQTQDWYPHRTVCKRFNIPDPYPDSTHVGVASARKSGRGGRTSKDSSWNLDFVHTERIVPTEEAEPKGIMTPPTGHVLPQTRAKDERGHIIPPASVMDKLSHVIPQVRSESSRVTPQASQDQTNPAPPASTVKIKEEIVPEERPPMDLFKAIFADSSSEDDSPDSDTEPARDKVKDDKEDKTLPPITTNSLLNMPKEKKWQDLSVITSTVLAPPTGRTHVPLPGKPLTSAKNILPRVDSHERDRHDIGNGTGELNRRNEGGRGKRDHHDNGAHHHGNSTRHHSNSSHTSSRDREEKEKQDGETMAEDRTTQPAASYGPALPMDTSPIISNEEKGNTGDKERDEGRKREGGGRGEEDRNREVGAKRQKHHKDHHKDHHHHHHKKKKQKKHKESKEHRKQTHSQN